MLNFASIVIEIALVLLLVRKSTFRSFPVFCTYLVWDIVDNLGLYTIAHLYPASYFVFYLTALGIDSIFVFAVLVELAWSVLLPFRSALPRGAIVVVAFLAGALFALIWPFTHSIAYIHYGPQSRLLLHIQQTVAIMRILFFLVLAGCSQLLSINWRDREMQIATGLGLYSLVSVAISILQAGQTAGPYYDRLSQIAVASYLCSLIYWTFSFAKQAAPRREFTPQMQSFLLAVAGNARGARIALSDSRSQDARRRDD